MVFMLQISTFKFGIWLEMITTLVVASLNELSRYYMLQDKHIHCECITLHIDLVLS